jgi:hypothetical protein
MIVFMMVVSFIAQMSTAVVIGTLAVEVIIKIGILSTLAQAIEAVVAKQIRLIHLSYNEIILTNNIITKFTRVPICDLCIRQNAFLCTITKTRIPLIEFVNCLAVAVHAQIVLIVLRLIRFAFGIFCFVEIVIFVP